MELWLLSKCIEKDQKGIVASLFFSTYSLTPLPPIRRDYPFSLIPLQPLTNDTAKSLDLYEDTRTTWREMSPAFAKNALTDKAFAPWKLAAYLAQYADRLYYTPKRSEVNPKMQFKVVATVRYTKHKVKVSG